MGQPGAAWPQPTAAPHCSSFLHIHHCPHGRELGSTAGPPSALQTTLLNAACLFSTARATQAETSTSNSGALPNAVGALSERHRHTSRPQDAHRTAATSAPTRRPSRRTARPAETEAPGRAVSGGRRERGWGRFEPLAARPGRLRAGLCPPRGSGNRRPGPARARPLRARTVRYGRRGGGRAGRGVGAAGGSEWEMPPSSARLGSGNPYGWPRGSAPTAGCCFSAALVNARRKRSGEMGSNLRGCPSGPRRAVCALGGALP